MSTSSSKLFLYFILPSYLSISFALNSGSWCPYQSEKIIPCRVRNGSEPYYGPNICWRNDNGSYACTKKVLYRPKYITTYKKVMETKFRCCTGFSGLQCEKECFNCSSYQRMEERIASSERRLSRLEKSSSKAGNHAVPERLDRFHRDYLSHNNVFSASQDASGDGVSSLAYITMNLRVQTLLDEFRDMQNRIRLLENELSRLNSQVDDLTISNNLAYDYTANSAGDGGTKDIRGIHVNKDNPTVNTDDTDRKNDLHQEHDASTTLPTVSHHSQHRHSGRSDNTIRVLEENLERGDIASTLNDDYGDELYNDNSTEQYIDQLHLKREQHSP